MYRPAESDSVEPVDPESAPGHFEVGIGAPDHARPAQPAANSYPYPSGNGGAVPGPPDALGRPEVPGPPRPDAPNADRPNLDRRGPARPGPDRPGPDRQGPGSGRPSAAMLLPANSTELSQPATWGWRGQVAKITGGRVAMEPTPEEVRWREARLAVRQSYSRPLSVVFANPKGGAGKTPATACVASTFGVMRGGGVVAWDNNETRGTLAVRTQAEAHAHTVWDLLAHLDWFERPDARLGDLDQFMRNQGESYYDVLASDEHPGNMAQIGRDEFARIRAVLERYYRIICIDTGNNVRAANWQASIEAADLLVVCTSWRRDDAYTAAWMLDHLEQSGHRKLIERAVTVVSSRDRQIDGALRSQVLEHFGARTSAVVEIPFDPHLAMGERISYPSLQRGTQDAWLLASAAIAHGLALQDQTSREIRLN